MTAGGTSVVLKSIISIKLGDKCWGRAIRWQDNLWQKVVRRFNLLISPLRVHALFIFILGTENIFPSATSLLLQWKTHQVPDLLGPKWRLLTIPHFVDNDVISSYRSFMPKSCTCCNTNWLRSNRVENQVSIYAFRGTAALKVALDQFLLKGGHQHRARDRISLKSGQILSVILYFDRRFSFILSNQSHSPL